MIKRLLYKAFIGGQWSIGYRDKQNDPAGQYRFAGADLPKGQWVADPFLFENEGKHYLFCEQYEESNNRAGIGYFLFEDGIPRNKGIVIRRPYHMSYPCIFRHKGSVYMIPETSANKSVELYRAVQFPDQWELDGVLLENVKYADATLHEENGRKYLLAYTTGDKQWHLDVFLLDMEQKCLEKIVRRSYDANIARPAGFLYNEDEKLMRPAQKCDQKYGEALNLYQVHAMDEGTYEETLVSTVYADACTFPQKVQRIHTLNQDSQYEVVDVFREKFDLLHAWKIFKRAILRK